MINDYIHAETLLRKEQNEADFVEPEHILDSGITLLSLAQWHQNIVDTTCLPDDVLLKIEVAQRDFLDFSIYVFVGEKIERSFHSCLNVAWDNKQIDEIKAVWVLKEIEQYLRDGKF
jgi:hypothetical protein